VLLQDSTNTIFDGLARMIYLNSWVYLGSVKRLRSNGFTLLFEPESDKREKQSTLFEFDSDINIRVK
jgi:hypothetical protein